MSKLLIVDGNGLVCRYFFAGGRGAFPATVRQRFLRALLALKVQEAPTSGIVAWDSGTSGWRHRVYPPYKANRSETPEALRDSLRLSRDVGRELGWHTSASDDCEADDLIAAAVEVATEDLVVVVTGDKDLCQLTGANVVVLMPERGGYKVIDRDWVLKHWGFEPWLLRDAFALIGDTADNIPGVRGIGEHGAAELIREWGALSNVYANLERLRSKTRQLLIEGRERAALSYRLLGLREEGPCVLP